MIITTVSDKLHEKKECCGCGACVKICPTGALKITTDDEGFIYPSVDELKCTKCGLCEKSCAFINYKKPENSFLQEAYLVKHKNQQIRMNSRSGAAFVAVSDKILEMGGTVYGCVLDENLYVKHVCAKTPDERNKMCGSKYVFSDITDVYDNIENDLKENKKVLFSGTGCQTDAVKKYFITRKIDISNLYTMDLVCHGSPSPLIWSDYTKWVEKNYDSKIESFNFRDKTKYGWESHKETAVLTNRKKYVNTAYRNIYNSILALRPSCYNCKYTTTDRSADITIADAWGVGKINPKFHDNRGVSLVLVNSEKGNQLFDTCKADCEIIAVNLEDYKQPNLIKPSKPNGNREDFWKLYSEKGIDGLIEKYTKKSAVGTAKDIVKRILRKISKGHNFYLPIRK